MSKSVTVTVRESVHVKVPMEASIWLSPHAIAGMADKREYTFQIEAQGPNEEHANVNLKLAKMVLLEALS